MKAVAVHPGTPGSMHVREIPEPAVDDIPGGRQLLTTPIEGLHNYEAMLRALNEDPDAIKVFVEVARRG